MSVPPELTAAECRYIARRLLAPQHDPLTVRTRDGVEILVCRECRREIWAEMWEPWQGHRDDCPELLRPALLAKLAAYTDGE